MSIDRMVGKAAELGLSVDEHTSAKQKAAAEDIMRGIGGQTIPEYKKQQLPLQGQKWKTLSQLEKEICRMKDCSQSRVEEYRSELQEAAKRIKEELSKCYLSEAQISFICHLSTKDRQERSFFLKWMKLKLDTHSRNKVTMLRNSFKEQCKKKDAKRAAELDQALLESSLGIEHYIREMGLIYEFSLQSQYTSDLVSRLPALAADMLLDGYPLELLDGDASNIPERWVSDVLMELHRKVENRSRLLVLTVLGVQSSGKSTLLNTMFGVQFPVSSGRCTRGAYMVFLRVGEEFKTELDYDFILLIDTEGLKSPDLAQLVDSYEHDNQLATFVIGLSDVTIINIAMENMTEMKDVLQIAAHAFLRMKNVGKKPICYFAHQNVGGVSAHSKLLSERKHLLDLLNQMTVIAAEMEKQPLFKAFTDVLDYDIEKNNWNIPGLWHGTPPMAPVNTGYSEAVADFKKHLLESAKRDRNEAMLIPDFLQWMKDLWKAVKYENFIFSFRNTLVAHAYNNLCKEFHEWEWEFRKKIFSWQKDAEMEILNDNSESEGTCWGTLVEAKKAEGISKIESEQKIMQKKLSDYYEKKDRHVNLLEKYKTEFFNSINWLKEEIQQSVRTKLDCILKLKISTKKAQDIQRKYRTAIEGQVMKLLNNCKRSKLSDEELKREFEKTWTEATANLSGLKERNIAGCVLEQLRKNFSNLNVNEELQHANLEEAGKSPFKVKREHTITSGIFGTVMQIFKNLLYKDLVNMTDSVIESCTKFIHDEAQAIDDYHNSLTRSLLQQIDVFLRESSRNHNTNTKFEIDLKFHICGIASREFIQMHRRFLANIDPRSKLESYKTQYCKDFLDLYKKRDDCQRKADDFVQVCIKPAVEDYINRSLGIEIVDEILTSCHSAEYSSRSFFQYNIQKELLQKDNFDHFYKYISKYDIYVKDWIFHHIEQKMSEAKTLTSLKSKNLQVIVAKITEALEAASRGEDGALLQDNKENITVLISQLRKHLIKDISISVESEKMILFQIQSTCHPFISSLKKSTEDLNKQLQDEYSASGDVTSTLKKLPVKPQDELFKRVFGCGKQCPFCKTPCEAGGKEHKVHCAAIHRPQGLGGYRNIESEKLVETLCTTDVQSEKSFRNANTAGERHPYKDYTKYYPDWHIPPDDTIEASDYWKYILVKHNDRFAEIHEAKPADVPQAWKYITKEQALKGLKDAFNVNE